MAARITDQCWSVQALLSYHVPPPVGHHPSNMGVPRMHSNASWSSGAGITVSCGATPYEYSAKIAHFDAHLPPMLCSSQQEVIMWVKTDLPVPVIRALEGLVRMAQALMK